ncbi:MULTISPECIES: diguanylate cyclase [unclassified Serratia (in: enterobacteria)]|uniref:diguanylate cyclase n=1 Tax=unclassified Serratia (in: enterobacteria) TaxID=2647522 RepID=UPI000502A9A6|nr:MULTISPECIES: diguanylate cyclase [unclassified Serratia (in: enterobacteria)]KFK96822.1 diguanylate cyclase [Serratia sp. Ag2]KFK97365.1 diguanylate cyclase [Serratia sp. Ag1]
MDISAANHPTPSGNSLLMHSLLMSVMIFLLAYLCLTLSTESSSFTPLWFPTAAIIILLYRYRPQYWLLPLLLSGVSICTANIILFGLSWIPFKLTLMNLLEAVVSALLLQHVLQPTDPLDSLASWLKFVTCAVIFTPMFSALLAVSWVPQLGQSFWQAASTWFISEAIGVLALTPIGLVYRRSMLKELNLAKLLLILIAILFFSYLVLVNLPYPFAFVTLPLLWAAISLSRLKTFIICFATTLMITVAISLGLLHFSAHRPFLGDVEIYLPLILILIPAHSMSMVMHAFRVEKKRIIESETRFRNALEYSAIGMALVSPEGKWLQVNQALCKLLHYPPETLWHLTFQEITHPDDLNADLTQLQELLAGNISSYTMEKRFIRSDGESVWTLLAVSLVRDPHGQPLYFISQVEDINELKLAEAENRLLIERITLANRAGGIGVWEWMVNEQQLIWDKRMFELYDFPLDQIPTPQLWRSLLLPEDLPRINQLIAQVMEHPQLFVTEFRILTRQGKLRYIRGQGNLLLDEHGKPQRLLGTNIDVTEVITLTKSLHEEKERLHITLDAIGEGVISTDSEMCITFMNPVAEQMSGWSLELAQGMPIDSVIRITNGRNGPIVENPVQLCLQEETTLPPDYALVLHSRDSRRFDIQISVSPLKTVEGAVMGAVIVLLDVSASRELMKKLSYSASHDALTNLQNRTSFEKQLQDAIASVADNDQQHSLVFLDLDRFKAVNDTAGHAAGDALLKEISQLMQRQLRNHDSLARLGGDEFGLILFDCPQEQAKTRMQQIVSLIGEYPFYWESKLYHVGASAGITSINASSGKSTELLAQADLACYTAKHRGRGQVYTYEARQEPPIERQHELLTRQQVVNIINQQQLQLYVKAVSPPNAPQAICFYQLILRVTADTERPLTFKNFSAAAQLYGLLPEVDRWVVEQILDQHALSLTRLGVSIALPLTTDSLLDRDFQHYLRQKLAATLLPHQALLLIIDEAIILDHTENAGEFSHQLQQMGCRLIVNGFGRSLNAFDLLNNQRLDYIRIDERFITNVHNNQMDELMVSLLNNAAHRIDAKTLAGPVELPATLNTLATLGIDLVDGDIIAPAKSLAELLDDGTR